MTVLFREQTATTSLHPPAQLDPPTLKTLTLAAPGRDGRGGIETMVTTTVKGNNRTDRLADEANSQWPGSQKTGSVEELEILPAGTKPRTLNHRSPAGERRRQRKRVTIFYQNTTEDHHCQHDHCQSD